MIPSGYKRILLRITRDLDRKRPPEGAVSPSRGNAGFDLWAPPGTHPNLGSPLTAISRIFVVE
jgi:hypothetical protein